MKFKSLLCLGHTFHCVCVHLMNPYRVVLMFHNISIKTLKGYEFERARGVPSVGKWLCVSVFNHVYTITYNTFH